MITSQRTIGPFASLIYNANLTWRLLQRDIAARYRGSIIGLVWSFLNPLFMLAVYSFVFTHAFKAQWPSAPASVSGTSHYTVMLFAGMVIHGFVAECLNRAPYLILHNPNYVKKVIFPIEILSWIGIGTAMFHAAVSLFVLVAGVAFLTGIFPITVVWFPFVVLPLVLFCAGCSWVLAAGSVYLRDIPHTTTVVTTVLGFLSPVFYPLSALPANVQPLLYLNPLTWVIENTRMVLIQGQAPVAWEVAVANLVGWCVCILGYACFNRLKSGFADVL